MRCKHLHAPATGHDGVGHRVLMEILSHILELQPRGTEVTRCLQTKQNQLLRRHQREPTGLYEGDGPGASGQSQPGCRASSTPPPGAPAAPGGQAQGSAGPRQAPLSQGPHTLWVPWRSCSYPQFTETSCKKSFTSHGCRSRTPRCRQRQIHCPKVKTILTQTQNVSRVLGLPDAGQEVLGPARGPAPLQVSTGRRRLSAGHAAHLTCPLQVNAKSPEPSNTGSASSLGAVAPWGAHSAQLKEEENFVWLDVVSTVRSTC